MSQLTDFKQELGELLKKYDASINFSVGECSDTYGLYDERLTVSFLKLQKKTDRFKSMGKEYTLADGYSVDKSDIK